MLHTKKLARIAGFTYLLLIIFGVFAELYVRSGMIIPGDIHTTIANILASPTLFRLGFVSDLMMMTTYFFLAVIFYVLFRNTHKIASGILVACVMVAVAIMIGNMINQIGSLTLVENPIYKNLFDPKTLEGMVAFHIEKQKLGYMMAQIFFGLWLLPLGYLVHISNWFPRYLGIILMIACFSYLIDFFLFFLFPDIRSSITTLITLPTVIGEFWLAGYLMIYGTRENITIDIGK